MPRSNPLTQALEQQGPGRVSTSPPARKQPPPSQPSGVPPSRSGRVLIGAHFAPEVQRALKITAAEEGTTVQALLAEALNLLFAKRHKPEIADYPPDRPGQQNAQV